MPYKDSAKQIAYQCAWVAKRRRKWLRENGPCKGCGTRQQLQIDHKDPSKKISHRVWSWSEVRRLAELAKCQVLCKRCHREKSRVNREHARGVRHGQARLSDAAGRSSRDSRSECQLHRACTALQGSSLNDLARAQGQTLETRLTRCGSIWLERPVRDRENARSNRATSTMFMLYARQSAAPSREIQEVHLPYRRVSWCEPTVQHLSNTEGSPPGGDADFTCRLRRVRVPGSLRFPLVAQCRAIA
jgi:hypothetical protein